MYINRYEKFYSFVTGLAMMLIMAAPLYIYGNEISPVEVQSRQSGLTQPAKKISGVDMVLVSGRGIQDFWISRHEVTQELYEAVMGVNPGYFKGPQLPVEQVSWFNAVEFCNKLSSLSGLTPCYYINKKKDDPDNINSGIKWTVTINSDADGFRLPSSAEWEYAARAGGKWKYFWGDVMNGDYCWYSGNSDGKTHPVGGKKPNAYGIFDICGNVQEWCFDWHPSFFGQYRVIRDGQFNLNGDEMSVSSVDYRSPQFEFGFTGIRLVMNR